MKGVVTAGQIVQGVLGLIMLFAVGKLFLILWTWGVWQDLFGFGK